MRIGFIGAGKVGCTLGKYMKERLGRHIQLTGYYSRNLDHARAAAVLTSSYAYSEVETLVQESDLIFLTVTDGAIKEIWEQLKILPMAGKILCHTSGAMASTIFEGIQELGASGYSLHPLSAISDRIESHRKMESVLFTLEGSQSRMPVMKELLQLLGNPYEIIEPEHKVKYHCAAVFLSNHVIALAETGQRLFAECGLSQDTIQEIMNTLLLDNVTNLIQMGTKEALTGPVERNDLGTIKNHQEVLQRNDVVIYQSLSRVLLELAKNKNPQVDYGQLEKELWKQ